MRKTILAASTALTIVGLAGAAFAQSGPNPITPGAPGAAFGGSTGVSLPAQSYEPGTVQAYVRGRMYTDLAILGDSADKIGGKSSPIAVGEAVRLYWGFAGTTANGLNYGAWAETRENAGGVGGSGNTATNTIKYQQSVAYVGGKWGTFRFGQSYDALLMFMTGTFENIGDTAWDGDFGGLNHSSTTLIWPFDENSGEYGDIKFTYLSPQWNGFDFGLSWQPNTAGMGYPQGGTAGAADPRTITIGATTATGAANTFVGSTGTVGFARETNMINVVGRYAGNLGPVGVVATAGIATGGTVGNGGVTGLTANGSAQYRYSKPFAFDTGVTATYGGFSVGGHLVTGKINPNGSNELYALPAGKPSATAWLVGAQYVMGSWGFSASYQQMISAGNIDQDVAAVAGVGALGKYSQKGAVASVAYNYGPGATLAFSYEYGQKKQANYNFYTGTRGTSGNNTKAQGLILTNYFQW